MKLTKIVFSIAATLTLFLLAGCSKENTVSADNQPAAHPVGDRISSGRTGARSDHSESPLSGRPWGRADSCRHEARRGCCLAIRRGWPRRRKDPTGVFHGGRSK